MQSRQYAKGAPRPGAPFFWLLLCACLLACGNAPARADEACRAGPHGERIRVSHVYDGDTVKLEDGRRLRLIGINAPETGHHGGIGQPYARKARKRLQELLANNGRVLRLQPGREHHDRYGRLLAHAFLENDESVAVRLLAEGLATTLAVPPNVSRHDCYQRHEDHARRAGRGLWSLPAYRAKPARTLRRDTIGFRIVRGKVLDVRRSRNAIQVNLEGPLQIYVHKSDSSNFRLGYLQALEGAYVEGRGWIRSRRGGLSMKVRHPAALARVPASANRRR